MKTQIAKTDKYILAVDTSINRIYYTMVGLWQYEQDVPDYTRDWEKALTKVTKGFTILTDMTQSQMPHPRLKPMFERVQRTIIEAGLKKTAELFRENAALAELALVNIAKRSGMPTQRFTDRRKAEAWLDGPSA